MNIYFKDGGFYIEGFNDEIPDGAFEVSQEEYDALFEGQANGKVIVTGKDGRPELSEPAMPSHEFMVEMAEQNRQSLINQAMQSVSVLQLKLQAGRKLTAAEMDKLNKVLDYTDLIYAVDTSTAPDIDWPELPS